MKDSTKKNAVADPFFIVGCPRSGTTLLSVMLDRHSRLCVTPETAYFDELAPFITNDLDKLLKRLTKWGRFHELRLEIADIQRELQGRSIDAESALRALTAQYACNQNKSRCGEKTPQHLRHTPEIINLFPSARIFCMYRDGRDVALSLMAMPWYQRPLADAARLWKNSIKQMEQFSLLFPEHFIPLRYEDLVTSPRSVLEKLMPKIEEKYEQNQLNLVIPSGVVLERSKSWKGLALQRIDPSRSGGRLHEADKRDLLFLEDTLGTELTRLGYV
jgi:hypothetical protein